MDWSQKGTDRIWPPNSLKVNIMTCFELVKSNAVTTGEVEGEDQNLYIMLHTYSHYCVYNNDFRLSSKSPVKSLPLKT